MLRETWREASKAASLLRMRIHKTRGANVRKPCLCVLHALAG